MNPAVKKIWTDALRSGKYKKGRAALRSRTYDFEKEDKYCCLGVLNQEAANRGIIPQPTLAQRESYQGKYYAYNGNYDYLTPEVRVWAGLDESDPRVIYSSKGYTRLSYINDNTAAGFNEIAGLIEEQL